MTPPNSGGCRVSSCRTRRAGTRRHPGNAAGILTTMLAGVLVFVMGTVGALSSNVTANAGQAATHRGSTGPGWPATASAPSAPSRPAGQHPPTAAQPAPEDPLLEPVLAGNPVNAAGNTATLTPCLLPPFSSSVAGQDAYYHAVLPCLMTMWTGALGKSHLPVQMPSVVTTGSDIGTPCGDRRWEDTAMYCPGNNTIYMTARHYSQVEKRTAPGAYLGQFAHEFGHAVQHMAGIYQAKDDELDDSGGMDTPAGLEVTRRTELQATCFEGMELSALGRGGVSQTDISAALADSRQRGDEYNSQPDHGTVAINGRWLDRGYNTDTVSQCNTWSAPSSDVS